MASVCATVLCIMTGVAATTLHEQNKKVVATRLGMESFWTVCGTSVILPGIAPGVAPHEASTTAHLGGSKATKSSFHSARRLVGTV